jgi:hypothetical protein
MNIQSLILQGEWEKFSIFSILWKSMGCDERTIWSHAQMDLWIVSCWVLSQRECLSKELELAMLHSNFYVKNWVYFWKKIHV